MKEELKPCPFCGGKAAVYETERVAFCYCTVCDAEGATEVGENKVQKAEEYWNERTSSERDIPKKPFVNSQYWAECPNCGGSISKDNIQEHIIDGDITFCEHCGQSIDWA